jgi:hypothetical protein
LSMLPVEMFSIRIVNLGCDLDTMLHSLLSSAYSIRRCGRRKGCEAYKLIASSLPFAIPQSF